MWKQLSEELETAALRTAGNLVHIGGSGIPGRTGLIWGDGLVVTLARQARDGESVPVVVSGGAEVPSTVHAWDSRTGLVVLKVPGVLDPKWKTTPVPGIGALVLTVAFASPQGPEARLDLVRFVGRKTEWGKGVVLDEFFQTDGNPWPGFTGAAAVDSDGRLLGFVTENRAGNGGFVVGAVDLARLVETLVQNGSPRQAWLGVSTRPGGGQGLVLLSVDNGSPADRAGWKTGDLLVSLAGEAFKEPSDLVAVLAGLQPDREVPARILRDGQVHDKPVTPGGR